jgi:hypothetical protein
VVKALCKNWFWTWTAKCVAPRASCHSGASALTRAHVRRLRTRSCTGALLCAVLLAWQTELVPSIIATVPPAEPTVHGLFQTGAT